MPFIAFQGMVGVDWHSSRDSRLASSPICMMGIAQALRNTGLFKNFSLSLPYSDKANSTSSQYFRICSSICLSLLLSSIEQYFLAFQIFS